MYTANLNGLKNPANHHNIDLLFWAIGTLLCLKKLIENYIWQHSVYTGSACWTHQIGKKRPLCPVFNDFWIFHNTDSGGKKDLTVVQYLLNHSILLTLRKSGLGRKGVCFPHYPAYPQGYSEHAGKFFAFHSYRPQRAEDCTLQLSEHSISTRSQILCTSRITTLLQHFIMPITRIHKQL